MSIVVLVPNAYLEPLAGALDAWIKWLRPGTLSAKIGTLKGEILPMVQGVYYDREALIDEHAEWEEGKRKVEKTLGAKGELLREEVIMTDPRKFVTEMRAFLNIEQPVMLPYLMEEKWIEEQAKQLVKDQMGLTAVDFGALRYIRIGYAKIKKDE